MSTLFLKTHEFVYKLDHGLIIPFGPFLTFIFNNWQIYSLDKPCALSIYYDPAKASERSYEMERMAEQLATLCSTLGEYPSIRYRA